MPIERTCPTCSKRFRTYPSKLAQGRGNYCSRACNAKTNLLRHGATRHGKTRTPTYYTWSNMLQRCQNPKAYKYPSYGGAGVTVCPEWQTFDGFLRDMGERPEATTLDRIDGTRGYSKDNCRWATTFEQQANLKSNVLVQHRGEILPLSALARRLGLGRETLAYRIRQGWTDEEIERKPSRSARVVV